MIRRGQTNRASRADERGAVVVEFAFIAVLFFTLLLAIISFAILLSFKQNMTQAASEAARASIAVEEKETIPNTVDERKEVAIASMEASVGEFNRQCGTSARCLVEIHECGADTAVAFAAIASQSRAQLVEPDLADPSDPCLSTRIEFDNSGSSRILPPFPLVSAFEPDSLSSQTTVRLVPVPQLTP